MESPGNRPTQQLKPECPTQEVIKVSTAPLRPLTSCTLQFHIVTSHESTWEWDSGRNGFCSYRQLEPLPSGFGISFTFSWRQWHVAVWIWTPVCWMNQAEFFREANILTAMQEKHSWYQQWLSGLVNQWVHKGLWWLSKLPMYTVKLQLHHGLGLNETKSIDQDW